MKALIQILAILLNLFSWNATACCSAGQYRLFPVGAVEGEMIMWQVQINRYCQGEIDEGVEVKYRVTFQTGYYWEDSMRVVLNADTLMLNGDCTMSEESEKSTLITQLLPHYSKALALAKKEKNYMPVQPLTYQYHNSEEAINGFVFKIDTTDYSVPPELFYKQQLISFQPSKYTAMGYLCQIREIRTYKIGKDTVTIMNLADEQKSKLPQQVIAANKKRFKNLKTALTYCANAFHGGSYDYIIRY